MSSAHIWFKPPAIALTPDVSRESIGVVDLTMETSPDPKSPKPLYPQHFTAPVSISTHSDALVAVSATAPDVKFGTCLGTRLLPDTWSVPQHFTAPTLVIAQDVERPAMVDAPAIALGLVAEISFASATTRDGDKKQTRRAIADSAEKIHCLFC